MRVFCCQHCVRDLMTSDLDLRDAMFVQFYFRFGCTHAPRDHDENVLVEFSTNGGVTWSNLMQLQFDQYAEARSVSTTGPLSASGSISKTGSHRVATSVRGWSLERLLF